ncbi:MAG: hypothetical protein HRU41_39265 [Saprospiraceae bacterium]|nr:hypothetical protein [Saprospiraceae bacterium]
MKQIFRAIPLSAPGIGSDVLCIYLLVICQFYVPMVLGSSMEANQAWVRTMNTEKVGQLSHHVPRNISSALKDTRFLLDRFPLVIPMKTGLPVGEPQFITPVNNLHSFSTGPFDCTAAFAVPYPNWTGSCALRTLQTAIIEGQSGAVIANIPNGASRYVSQIPTGCHLFRFTIKDACGNTIHKEEPFWVVDDIAPTAICVDELNLSLNDFGLGQLQAHDIDEGSEDNCGAPLKLEVRRKYDTTDHSCSASAYPYSEWGPQVIFNCCDAGDQVLVELRVWDDANGNGVPGDVINYTLCNGQTVQWSDNSNGCWMEVLVEDKTAGQCLPPHDKTISCADLPYDFDPNQTALLVDLFGEPQVIDNCGSDNWQELSPILALGTCMEGTITRRFQLVGGDMPAGNTNCQQTISVLPVPQYEIRFPADEAAICGVPDPDTITFQEGACDLLAVSVDDELFSASGDACYKILRTYQVINWCEYDGESLPIVVGRDEDCDGRPGDEAIWVIVNGGATFFDANRNPTDNIPIAGLKSTECDGLSNPEGHWLNNTLAIEAMRDPITGQVDNGTTNDNIRDIESRGFWSYTQHIKVYDTLAPVITVEPYPVFEILNGETCEGEVQIEFSVADACTEEEGLAAVFLHKFIEDIDQDGNITQAEFVQDNEITAEISGSPSKYIYTTSLPEGQHALLIKAIDGCGNTTVDLILFELVDNKAPSPICINGLVVELSPVEEGTDADADMDPDWGAASVWAIDFIASPVQDCNGPVTYSINRVGESSNSSYIGLVVTCDDPGSIVVEIHAWDSNGNNDYCETYLLIEDNLELCYPDPEGDLAGGVQTEAEQPVDLVEVRLSGPMQMDQQTDGAGQYEFVNLPEGYDYTIQPYSDEAVTEGVTTLDIIYILQHILGERPLESPYKRIAADVDQTGSITTLDIIHLRRLILGIDDKFQSNTSWRFVPRDYTFPNPSNPWEESFPEVININNLNGQLPAQDFVAIKIGDVFTAPGSLRSPNLRFRSQDQFAVVTTNELVQPGQVVDLLFEADCLEEWQGAQFTLSWDPLDLDVIGLKTAQLKTANFGRKFLQAGELTVSWNRGIENANEEEKRLFSLQLVAKRRIEIEKAIHLNSSRTPAEAYNLAGEIGIPKLKYRAPVVGRPGFRLEQNSPNPFRRSTTIGFHIPESNLVRLVVSNLNGKELYRLERYYEKGYHRVELHQRDMAIQGTVLYTLTAGKHTATRKMIFYE